MGNQAGKGGESSLTAEQVQQRYHVTPEQITALQAAFAMETKKGLVDEKTFVQVIERLREQHPELVPFDKDVAPMVFTLSDVEHKGRLDPFELLAALSIFRSGNVLEKAALVFRVIDKDCSHTLTRQEVQRHAAKVLRLAQQLVTDEIRAKGKEQDMEKLSKLAAWTMSKAMNVFEKKFVEDIVKDVFLHDADKNGLISESEWLAAADSNTIKCLVDPQLSARVWQTVFSAEDGGGNELLLQQCQTDPRGYCLLFDIEVQGVQPLGPNAAPAQAQAPPAPLVVTFKFVNREGAEQTEQKEFLPRAKWAYLVEVAESFPCIVTADNLHLGCNGADLNIKNHGDKDTLVSSLVEPGSVVTLFDYKAPRSVTLTIKMLTGKEFVLEPLDGFLVVARVMDRIQDKEGIPPTQQRLVFQGRQLDCYQTLDEQGVIDGATLFLVLCLRGDN